VPVLIATGTEDIVIPASTPSNWQTQFLALGWLSSLTAAMPSMVQYPRPLVGLINSFLASGEIESSA